ncbi:MAG TPA: PIN domain-containing protein [bacterium]
MEFFLDANILFSACVSPTGRSAALIDLANRGFCKTFTSAHAVEEARRNLEARYPKELPRLEVILRIVETIPEAPPDTVERIQQTYDLPAEDAPVLAAAIAGAVDAFVTGDRTHFGRLFGRTGNGVRILSLREALKKALE